MLGRGRQRRPPARPPAVPLSAALLLLLLVGGTMGSVENATETKEQTREAAVAAMAAITAAVPEAAVPLEDRLAQGERTRFIVTFKQDAVAAATASVTASMAMAPQAADVPAAVSNDTNSTTDNGTPTIASSPTSVASAAAAAPVAPAAASRPLTPKQMRRAARRAALASMKTKSLRAARVRAKGAKVVKELPNLPMSVVSVNSTDGLAALKADPNVASVKEDKPKRRMLKESLPLIKQPEAVARGYLGTGCSVAIIDGGGNIFADDLGACTAVGVPASCRVDFAGGFTDTKTFSQDPHATNVASIAARVAPGARVLLLDVFEKIGAYDSWILAALDWVAANADKYNICSVNLSLGDGTEYPQQCDGTYETAFKEIRNHGVIPVVAAGNEARDNGLSAPACSPSCVSVGATWDAGVSNPSSCDPAKDEVTCFSNIATYLDMLAPGAVITAGGYSLSGTSMATPHVTGAIAVLQAAKPDATPEDIISALKTGGHPVVDWRSSQTFPRLDLDGSLTALVGAGPRAPDTTPPTATVTINSGATVTSNTRVTVAITAQDNNGLTGMQMCIASAPACPGDTFKAFAATSAFDLPSGDGAKTVYVWLRDAANNTMAAPATASITLDTSGPVGTATIAGGATATRLPTVSVLLQATNANAVCFTASSQATSLSTSCSPWQAFTGSGTYKVPLTAGGQGQRTVRAVFRNPAGAVGPEATAAVTYDTVAPTQPSVLTVAASAPTTAALSWNPAEATDTTSGVSRFIVTYRFGAPPPAGCAMRRGILSTGTMLGKADSSATIEGLKPRKVYRFRLCVVDAAGNVSPGVLGTLRTQRPAPVSGRRLLRDSAA